MSGFWLMIYLSSWAHVFGTYATEDECKLAARVALAHTYDWWSSAPAWACVPRPAPNSPPTKPHDHPAPNQ